MKNKFQFYEVVEVIDNNAASLKNIIGEEGTILGMAEDENSHQWSYGVSMTSTGTVRCIDERYLQSKGKFKNRSDFYSGESIKINTDPHTGRGMLS